MINSSIKTLLVTCNENNKDKIIEEIANLEHRIRLKALIKEYNSKSISSNSLKNITNLPEFNYIKEKHKSRIKELTNSEISIESLKRILYLDFIAFYQFTSYISYYEISLNKAEETLSQINIIGKNFFVEPISNKKIIKN